MEEISSTSYKCCRDDVTQNALKKNDLKPHDRNVTPCSKVNVISATWRWCSTRVEDEMQFRRHGKYVWFQKPQQVLHMEDI